MVNLLPKNELKEILLDRLQKKILLALILIFFQLVFLFAFLVFLEKMLLRQSDDFLSEILQKNAFLLENNIQQSRQEVGEINNQLLKFQEIVFKRVYLSDFFNALSSCHNGTIYFSNIIWEQKFRDIKIAGSESLQRQIYATVSLMGVSLTREDLFNFREKLQQENEFANVYFNPSSWEKAEEGEFLVSLEFIPNISK